MHFFSPRAYESHPWLLSLLAIGALAQNLQVPSTWTSQESNYSRQAREGLAFGAATALIDQVKPSGGGVSDVIPNVQYLASLFGGLAIQDYLSGNTSWVNEVTQVMQENYVNQGVYSAPPATGQTGDANHWALAFYYAYRTYKQQFLLDTAIQIYNMTYTTAFITSSAATSGSGAGRNISFASPNCTHGTLAGGVFYYNDQPESLQLCGECTDTFLTLSAYLYEATNSSIYFEAAQLSTDFMFNYMWNGSIVYDLLYLPDCAPSPKPITLNQAGYVEGLAVWANVTQNSTLVKVLEEVVSNVTTFPAWSLHEIPVLTESGGLQQWDYNSKNFFIRGLAEARARNPGSDLSRYIEAYIMIQFNSLLSNAQGAPPNNNFYGTAWAGSPPTSFSAPGNLAALEVLNAAFSLVQPANGTNETATSASPATTSTAATATTSAPMSPSRSNVGAIAGGTVGGAILVVGCIAGFLWYRRRQTSARSASAAPNMTSSVSLIGRHDEHNALGAVDPFTMSSPSTQVPSKWRDNYAPSHSAAGPSSPVTAHSSRSTAAYGGDSDPARGPLIGSGQRSTSVQAVRDGTDMQEVAHAESDGLSEVPGLVGRLYHLLSRQVELPPAYAS
ncbi:unnamed protein product [Peniophora sp. CBMAI 1063]|nr:unnamed protein product [Peniophora sp. CBMAI 1063]